MLKGLKDLVADCVGIGCAAWILLHLVMLMIYGEVLIAEPNRWILAGEICLGLLVLALFIERLVRDIKKRR